MPFVIFIPLDGFQFVSSPTTLGMISLPRFSPFPLLCFFLSWIGRVAVTVAVTRTSEAPINDIVALSLSSSTGIGRASLFFGTTTCRRLLLPPTTFILLGICCFFAYKRTREMGILLWFSPQYDRSNFPFWSPLFIYNLSSNFSLHPHRHKPYNMQTLAARHQSQSPFTLFGISLIVRSSFFPLFLFPPPLY